MGPIAGEDQNNGQRFDGPTTALVDAPLDVLPYFFRCESDPVVPELSTTTTTTTTSPVGGGTIPPATPVPVQPRFTG